MKSANETDYALPGFVPAGSQDGSPQPLLPAGGAPGGNPQLYDVLYEVTATITNTGKVPGEEVPQLVSSFKSLVYPFRKWLTPTLVHLPRRPQRSQNRSSKLRTLIHTTQHDRHLHRRHHSSRYLELGYGGSELGDFELYEDGLCGEFVEDVAFVGDAFVEVLWWGVCG